MPWVFADTGEEVPTEQLPYLEAAERHAAGPQVQPSLLQSARDVAGEVALGPLHQSWTPAGRKVEGGREALLSAATGMVAFPAGVLAELGGLSSEEGNLARGRAARRQVEEAVTYQPRTSEGRQALEALGRVAQPEIFRPGIRKVGQVLGPEAEDVVAMAYSPLTWLGGARAPLGAAKESILRGGQRAAVRSLGAPGSLVGRLAESRGTAGMQELGQTVLDIPGARLARGPRGVWEPGGESPLGAAMDPVGKRVSDIAAVATQGGGVVDLGGVLERFDAATQGLAKDPFARERLAKVRDYVAQSAQGRGVWTPDQRQLMHLTPDEAWAMRRGLDDVIYGAEQTPTPLSAKSPVKQSFSQLRRLVDDALGESVSSSLGPEVGKAWAQANRKYHDLADVQRLARAGYRRQAAAEFSPPQGSQLRVGVGTGYRLPLLSRFLTSYPTQPSFGATAARARLSQFLAAPPPEPLAPLSF